MNARWILPHLLLLGACANLTPLQRDYQNLSTTLTQISNNPYALQCAPEALAMAQAHAAFADVEFKQGNPDRAADHVEIARKNAEAAWTAAEACKPQDRDNDGIGDSVDKCPDQPEDINNYEDDDGCPEGGPPITPVIQPVAVVSDRDGDGVVDSLDQCPDESEDLDGFKDVDGCPDPDNDNDQIPDVTDRCPLAAEDFDSFEDTDGCPDQDNDADGILDEMDECPLQAEVINEYLDSDGCPDAKPQRVEVTKEQIVIKEQILFQTGKAIIRPESYAIVDDVTQVLRDYPNIAIRIEGHTDSQGDDSMNMRLSKARADAVFEYILRKGIDARRMEAVGFGESRPIDTNLTKEGMQKNRRVEFYIVSGM